MLCNDCPWSPFSHVIEDLDHSPKISDDFPNIIARRFSNVSKCFLNFSREIRIFPNLADLDSGAGLSERLY